MEAALYNYPQRPLCFTLSTPRRASLGLDGHFQTIGLVNMVSKTPGLNLAALDRNILEIYRFRHMGDPDFILNNTAKRLVRSYKEVIRLGKRGHVHRLQQLRQQKNTPSPNLYLDDLIKKEETILAKYQALEDKIGLGK